jgi:hypothetical protein
MAWFNRRCPIGLGLVLWAGTWLGSAALAEKPKVPLIKLPVTFGAAMENTPFVFGGRPLLTRVP